ncbi:MAG: AAA family ATPase, partial [Pseudomonadota bacterium]
VADPQRAPEVLTVRERMRAWRFYDAVRTDQGAPARATRIGTRTFALSADGADLAAAVQTIREIGDGAGLDRAIDDAFEGAEIAVEATEGLFGLVMRQPGILRPLSVAELSDGTLRYLCLAAALMTPRPPPLIVLNEPETSLHPDLLPALGRLIVAAAASTQIIIVSHAPQLVEALVGGGALPLHLTKAFGETSADDHDRPPWNWPKRGSG